MAEALAAKLRAQEPAPESVHAGSFLERVLIKLPTGPPMMRTWYAFRPRHGGMPVVTVVLGDGGF